MMSVRLSTVAIFAAALLAIVALTTVAGEVNVIRTAFKAGERLHARQRGGPAGVGWSGSRAVDLSGRGATPVAQCQNECQSKYRYCQTSCKSFKYSGPGDQQGACLKSCDREVDTCQNKCTQPKAAAGAGGACAPCDDKLNRCQSACRLDFTKGTPACNTCYAQCEATAATCKQTTCPGHAAASAPAHAHSAAPVAAPKAAVPAPAAPKPRATPDYTKFCDRDSDCKNGLTCEYYPTSSNKYCDNKIHLPNGSCRTNEYRCPTGYTCKALAGGINKCLPK